MKILAFETSTAFGSLAVMDESQVYGEEIFYSPKTHSERLIPSVDTLLQRVGFTLSDMDLFAVAMGPGSFTGLRVGLGTVKAFAKAQHKKVVGVSSLEALSLNGTLYSGGVCSLLEACRGEVYAAVYRFQKEEPVQVLEEGVYAPEKLISCLSSPTVMIGTCRELFKELPRGFLWAPLYLSLPRASHVGTLALKAVQEGRAVDPKELSPKYIRLPQAQINLKKH